MHNKVTDKPKSTASSKSKRKRGNKVDTEKQKAISIESMQEAERATYQVSVAESACLWDMMIKE